MLNFIMNFVRFYIPWLFTPLQRLMQHMGKDECVITKAQVDRLLIRILPGDIVLSHERQRLTSIFIPGFWDHAAIVTGRLTVIESVGTGVREVPLEEWLYKKDYVKVKRPTQLPVSTRNRAADYASSFLGYAYNFTFSSFNPFHWDKKRKGVYCSELVYDAYAWADGAFKELVVSKGEILPIAFEVFETIDDTSRG